MKFNCRQNQLRINNQHRATNVLYEELLKDAEYFTKAPRTWKIHRSALGFVWRSKLHIAGKNLFRTIYCRMARLFLFVWDNILGSACGQCVYCASFLFLLPVEYAVIINWWQDLDRSSAKSFLSHQSGVGTLTIGLTDMPRLTTMTYCWQFKGKQTNWENYAVKKA